MIDAYMFGNVAVALAVTEFMPERALDGLLLLLVGPFQSESDFSLTLSSALLYSPHTFVHKGGAYEVLGLYLPCCCY
jgi:hypothetical protein